MPLLSLPVELLADIVSFTIGPPLAAGTCCAGDVCPNHRGCTYPPATGLTHTCQLLRSLTLPFMYQSVIAHLEFTPTLHTLLTSESGAHIATCVRSLTVFVSDAQGARLLHDIVACCTRLQDLRLDGSHATDDFATALLAHGGPRPQLSLGLRSFHWEQILAYLSAPPHRLHTLRVCDPLGPQPLIPAPEAPTPAIQLTSVHTLVCQTYAFDLVGPSSGGTQLARMLPNVDMVTLQITQCSVLMLETFVELRTRLTQLTISFDSPLPQVCHVVAKLAPSLRRYTSSGGEICERLFEADWACVEYFNVVADNVCDEVRPEVMRAALVKMVADRPRAEIKVEVQDTELVNRNEWGVSVASQDIFDNLGEQFECTFGMGLWM